MLYLGLKNNYILALLSRINKDFNIIFKLNNLFYSKRI